MRWPREPLSRKGRSGSNPDPGVLPLYAENVPGKEIVARFVPFSINHRGIFYILIKAIGYYIPGGIRSRNGNKIVSRYSTDIKREVG